MFCFVFKHWSESDLALSAGLPRAAQVPSGRRPHVDPTWVLAHLVPPVLSSLYRNTPTHPLPVLAFSGVYFNTLIILYFL